jgi:hypothetical protein
MLTNLGRPIGTAQAQGIVERTLDRAGLVRKPGRRVPAATLNFILRSAENALAVSQGRPSSEKLIIVTYATPRSPFCLKRRTSSIMLVGGDTETVVD